MDLGPILFNSELLRPEVRFRKLVQQARMVERESDDLGGERRAEIAGDAAIWGMVMIDCEWAARIKNPLDRSPIGSVSKLTGGRSPISQLAALL